MDLTDAELKEILAEVSRRSVIDPEFRRQALNNPGMAISRVTEKPLPAGISFKFVDNSGATKTIPLPEPVVEIYQDELSESDLEAVAGGMDITAAVTVGIGGGGKKKSPPPPPPPAPNPS